MQEKLADRYEELFRILLRYRKSVECATFWGLHDGIAGRTTSPCGVAPTIRCSSTAT